jgi:hypothetical protein
VVLTGFIWLRLEASGGLLRTFGIYKIMDNSRVAEELLASEEGFASTELVYMSV